MQQKIELLVITTISAITGTATPYFADLTNIEIPIIIIQLFQILSYSVAIIVGIATLYKFYKSEK